MGMGMGDAAVTGRKRWISDSLGDLFSCSCVSSPGEVRSG
jgi:hypothetical protein